MNKNSQKFYLSGRGRQDGMHARPAGRQARRAASRWWRTRIRCMAARWKTRSRKRWRAPSSALGYATARINFRGVGQSEGEHDAAMAKPTTWNHAVATTCERISRACRWRCRASRSAPSCSPSWHAAPGAAQGTPAERLVLVGTAAGKWPMPSVPADTILIHGETGRYDHPAASVRLGAPAGHPGAVIPGADHFFHRKLNHIKNLVCRKWRRDI
jgi:hypothetical protein